MFARRATRRFVRFYRRQSIRRKILWIVMAVIALSSLSISVYYYFRTTAYVQEWRTKNFVELMSQTQIGLDNVISSVEDTGKSIVLNETLEGILLNTERGAAYPLGRQIDDYAYLSKYINVANINHSINLVRLYFVNDAIYTRERVNFFHARDAAEKDWYERALFVSGAPVWSYQNGELTCARAIMRYELAQSECGFIEVLVNRDVVSRVLDNVIATTDGNICLMDDLGHTLFSRGRDAEAFAALVLENEELLKSAAGTIQPEAGVSDALIVRRKLTNDWSLVASLPYEGIRTEIRKISYEIIYICLIAILAAFGLVMWLTRSFGRRVKRIADFMTTVDINSDEYTREISGDELTIVETNFNQMLRTARDSVRKENEALRLKKEADFDVLQEQINPHFLYNCLDSINWLAVEYHAPEISQMTMLLSRFFRLGLSRGNQIVSLADELEHVRVYIEIMKKRFDGFFDVEFDIQPDPSRVNTLKFVLQPLVENAIVHGISNRESQSGRIRIACRLRKDGLILTVADDGVGIENEVLLTLLEALACGSAEAGFGLHNVNQRIKLHFGEAYGLSILSTPMEGTTVILKLPPDIQADGVVE